MNTAIYRPKTRNTAKMDKKMRKVTAKIRKAESTLKKAEKENVRLANYDERVRDPQIKRLKKLEKR
jgi:hypothetical protein